MNFKEELEQRTREAEEIIKSYLPKEEGFAKNIGRGNELQHAFRWKKTYDRYL